MTIKTKNRVTSDKYPRAGCQLPATSRRTPVVANRLPVTSHQLPAAENRKPATGFTLLEVMVAVAIMAIVLVSVYRMHSQTLVLNMAARFYTQAPLMAQSKLAELETASSAIFAGTSGDFGETYPGYAWRIDTGEVSSEALGEFGNDLKRIDITINFNDNEYVYSLRTYRLIRE